MEHLLAVLGLTAAIIVWYFVTRMNGEGDDSRVGRHNCKTIRDADECAEAGSESCQGCKQSQDCEV